MSGFGDAQELLHDFLTEAGELLEDVDSKLVELEQYPDDNGLLNTVFRGFHTIKGGAGFLEAHALVDLCHKTENLFDLLRSGKKQLNSEMLDTILAATGEVRRMFGEMAAGAMPGAAPAEMLQALADAIDGKQTAPPPKLGASSAPAVAASKPVVMTGLSDEDNGFFADDVPSNENVDWSALYTAVVGVEPKGDSAGNSAAFEAERVTQAVSRQSAAAVRPKADSPPPAKPRGNAPTAQVKENTIRIDTARFDQILNLSGEIGLTKNRLNCLRQDLTRGNNEEETRRNLDLVIGQLDMLVSDLQTAVMKARMQPVGSVFKKYTRLARDVARNLGKDVELVILGAETEVDKSILEELNDPLVHLVRNSVDHGIETPAERRAAGKPEKGTVTLVAKQAGDHIIVEISDDGKGMKAEMLRQKAIEKGCIAADEAGQLSNAECLQLIFLPGFSTKTEVTDISGRGVGMDVVKTNIQKLNGRIEINSEPGQGSRMTILLPLTLAILPVLMLRLEEQIYSLPLSSVREIIPIEEDKIQYVGGRANLVVRGDVLPIVDLATLLGRVSAPNPKVGVLAVTGQRTVVLAVDSLLGQDEVMIKPLEGIKPKGVSGATLSGEGLLVLVLELRELMEGHQY
ncbi:MAG: chemotaxis protein CheA [Burkholderiales bacterium]|jgi:two-component system chemotaxis sensor kinase CheA|nr:chemotaxis protein CheA [Burkholderiales bacterium]